MHLFDYDELRKTQASFFITTVLVSLITWTFAGFALWWVKKADSGGTGKLTRTPPLWRDHGSEGGDELADKSPPNKKQADQGGSKHGKAAFLRNLKNLRLRNPSKVNGEQHGDC